MIYYYEWATPFVENTVDMRFIPANCACACNEGYNAFQNIKQQTCIHSAYTTDIVLQPRCITIGIIFFYLIMVAFFFIDK